MKKITSWSRKIVTKDEDGDVVDIKFIHNHIEDGWVAGSTPQPIKKEYKNQLMWKDSQWKKDLMYLNDRHEVVYN